MRRTVQRISREKWSLALLPARRNVTKLAAPRSESQDDRERGAMPSRAGCGPAGGGCVSGSGTGEWVWGLDMGAVQAGDAAETMDRLWTAFGRPVPGIPKVRMPQQGTEDQGIAVLQDSLLSLSYDPIHGYVAFVDTPATAAEVVERDIIDHPWVQRLREIHQLQTAWYVFPSAEHSRFQHVVGAMHLGSVVADRLYPSLKAACPDAPSRPLVESLLRLAGLLHDVGHGPFGHFFDDHFLSQYGLTHETLGAHIIRDELGSQLRRLRRSPSGPFLPDESLDPGQIAWLIQRPQSSATDADQPRWLLFLRSLLSGIYTIDNMDFVLRDAYMAGYSQKSFDFDRLLHYSFFSDQGLTIQDRGIDSLIRFMAMRAELFRAVYFHRTVRAIDITLGDLFLASRKWLFPGNPLDHLDAYREFTEWSLIVDAKRWALSPQMDQREIGQRWRQLANRNVRWKMLCQRNLVFAEADAEHSSIFSDSRLVEQRVRGLLPTDLSDLPLRIDIARHLYRPQPNRGAVAANFLYDSEQERTRPLRDNQLFRYLPISHRVCRIYGESHEHAAEVARVLDQLIGPGGADDLTNM